MQRRPATRPAALSWCTWWPTPASLSDVVAQDSAAHDRDLVIYLTDHPRRTGLRPLVADLKRDGRVALACLPALGMLRLKRRARALVVRLVEELVGEGVARREGGKPSDQAGHDIGGPLAAIRLNTPEEAGSTCASSAREGAASSG